MLFNADDIDLNMEAKKWKVFVLSLVINDDISEVISHEDSSLIDMFKQSNKRKHGEIPQSALLKNLAFFIENASKHKVSKHSLITAI